METKLSEGGRSSEVADLKDDGIVGRNRFIEREID